MPSSVFSEQIEMDWLKESYQSYMIWPWTKQRASKSGISEIPPVQTSKLIKGSTQKLIIIQKKVSYSTEKFLEIKFCFGNLICFPWCIVTTLPHKVAGRWFIFHKHFTICTSILKINRWRFNFKTRDLLWVLLDTIYLNIVLFVEMLSCSWRAFVCWTFLVLLSFPNTQTTSKECLTSGLGQAQRVKCQCDKRMVFWENFS